MLLKKYTDFKPNPNPNRNPNPYQNHNPDLYPNLAYCLILKLSSIQSE